MNAPVKVELLPLGQVLQVEKGGSLQDVLFERGVEFPCGGTTNCSHHDRVVGAAVAAAGAGAPGPGAEAAYRHAGAAGAADRSHQFGLCGEEEDSAFMTVQRRDAAS